MYNMEDLGYKMKSRYSFEDRGTDRQKDGIDF